MKYDRELLKNLVFVVEHIDHRRRKKSGIRLDTEMPAAPQIKNDEEENSKA